MSRTGLNRVLGRWDVLALSFGAMIGWGWVVLAGGWIDDGGMLGAPLAFIVGGAVMMVIGLSYAELAAALPFVGGEHVYTERAFGAGASFICTWALIFAYVAVVAFEAVALPTAISYLFPHLEEIHLWDIAGEPVYGLWVAVGMVAAAIMTAINVIGIRLAARVQSFAVVLVVAAGLLLISGSLVGDDAAGGISRPMWGGAGGFASVLMMVPFLFVGFDVIPQSAEEVRISQNAMARVLVFSVLAAVLFYIFVILAVGLTQATESDVYLVTAAAAGAAWDSPLAASFIILAGIGGILTSWNAFLIGGSRAIFALARAGHLPAALGHTHGRFRTPWKAVLFIGALSVLAPLLGRSALIWFVNAGGFGIVIAYAFVAAAFIRLRVSEPEMPRPFRAPGGILTGGAALVLAIGLAALYLPGSPSGLKWPQEWGLVLGWIAIGGLFWAWGKMLRRPAALAEWAE